MGNIYYSCVSGEGVSAIATFILFGEHFEIEKIIKKIFIPKNSKNNPFTIQYEKINYGILKFNSTIYDEVILTLFKESENFPYIEHCEINVHGSIGIVTAIKELFKILGIVEITKIGLCQYLFKNGKINYLEKEIYLEIFKAHSQKYIQLLEEEQRLSFVDIIKKEISCVSRTKEIICELISKYQYIKRFKKPIKVGIFGSTNTGKSTLFNCLTATQRALVSSTPKTTRDYISEVVNFRDFAIEFIDTAGFFESGDFIDTKAKEITKKIWEKQDIIKLVVFSYDAPLPAELIKAFNNNNSTFNEKVIFVNNKIDLESVCPDVFNFNNLVKVSALKNINIDLLMAQIKKVIGLANFLNLTNPIVFTPRQYLLLNRMLQSLDNKENAKLELLLDEIQYGPVKR